ncbi:MFS transporter [Pelagibius marinus]|uniref:MFS transporter n=1 Tax=Pelagibius marinus TaxID=2762760 RepID=UPI0018728033|nr:MFS transporter [Pelagibius marinus]
MSSLKLLFVIGVAASLLMVGVGMIVPLLPQRVMLLSGSLQSAGFIASSFAISYVLIQLPLGRFADRLGVKPFLLLGYGLCALSGVLFFYAASPKALYLGRFIQGLGEAPIWALGPALLSLAYPQAKGRVIGLYNAAIHTGLAAGPLLGILLFPRGEGQLPFLVFAALCGLGGVTVLLLPRRPTPKEQIVGKPASLGETLALLRLRGPLTALSGIFLYGAGYGIFISVLPASLVHAKGFSASSTAVVFALFYGAISLSQIVAGPLSDRQGRHPYMVAGLVLAAAGFASFTPLPQPWTFGALTLASLGLGIFCVASMAYLNDCVPAALKGTISGSYYLSWGLGYFVGPVAVGYLAEASGALAAYALLAGAFALQALALHRSREAPAKPG